MTLSIPKPILLAAAALAVSGAARAGVPAGARAAIDARGGVHTVQRSADGRRAEYRYCAAGCAASAEVTVSLELEAPVAGVAVALTPEGKPRLLLETRHRVHYAACEGDCTSRTAWHTTAALEHGGRYTLDPDAFTVDAGGAVSFRITPRAEATASTRAFVASCAADCLDAARWTPHLERGAAPAAVAAASR